MLLMDMGSYGHLVISCLRFNGRGKNPPLKHRQIGPEIGKTTRPRRRSLNSLILLRMDLDGRMLFRGISTRFCFGQKSGYVFFLEMVVWSGTLPKTNRSHLGHAMNIKD